MELIHIVAGTAHCRPILSNSSPDLVLNDEHSYLLELLAKDFDVIADKAVVDINIGPVVKDIQRTFYINLNPLNLRTTLLL